MAIQIGSDAWYEWLENEQQAFLDRVSGVDE